jgi:hypothetical protein
MTTAILSKPKKRSIDWINPNLDKVKLEDYQSEMQAAENSGFISFEEHKNNMNKWLTAKL